MSFKVTDYVACQQFETAGQSHDIETVTKLMNENPRRVNEYSINSVFDTALYQNKPGDAEIVIEISKHSGKLAGIALYNSTYTPSRFNLFDPLFDLIVRGEIRGVSDLDKAVALKCAKILETKDMVQKMESVGFPTSIPVFNFAFNWPTKPEKTDG